MVHYDILALVAALCAHGNVAQEISEAQARQIAYAFAQFVNSDRCGASIVEDFSGEVRSARNGTNTWDVSGDKFSAYIDKRSGRVRLYRSDATPHIEWAPVSHPRLLIDDALCLSVAQAIYRQAGYPDRLLLKRRENVYPEVGFYGVEAHFARMVGDVEVDSSLGPSFYYHATSGQVLEMRLGPDLILPPDLTPRISLQDARRAVLAAIARHIGPVALAEVDWRPLRLRAWWPAEMNFIFQDIPFDHVAYAREWRTMLVYDVFYEDANARPDSSGFRPGWFIRIDAMTGKLLAVEQTGRSIGAPPASKPVPFGWDLGPGPIGVTVGGKTHELSSADVLRVQKGSPNEPGVPVLLQRARMILNALYYPKANLLSVGEGKLKSLGRPDDELRKALLTLTSKE